MLGDCLGAIQSFLPMPENPWGLALPPRRFPLMKARAVGRDPVSLVSAFDQRVAAAGQNVIDPRAALPRKQKGRASGAHPSSMASLQRTCGTVTTDVSAAAATD